MKSVVWCSSRDRVVRETDCRSWNVTARWPQSILILFLVSSSTDTSQWRNLDGPEALPPQGRKNRALYINLPFIYNPVYCENDALGHASTNTQYYLPRADHQPDPAVNEMNGKYDDQLARCPGYWSFRETSDYATRPDNRAEVDTADLMDLMPVVKREPGVKPLLHGMLSQHHQHQHHQQLMTAHRTAAYTTHSSTGSLPPSPADSGVSDVDSSSSGHTSNDELKARLQPTPVTRTPESPHHPGGYQHPHAVHGGFLAPYYQPHPRGTTQHYTGRAPQYPVRVGSANRSPSDGIYVGYSLQSTLIRNSEVEGYN
uniref:Uncharacterized protein n=1 Tax=Timema bartmani TaxID=61472 RepID=A0A7R9I2E7_9NEOP|nr:unnamed protein product [Timema bartmani]